MRVLLEGPEGEVAVVERFDEVEAVDYSNDGRHCDGAGGDLVEVLEEGDDHLEYE